VVRWGGFGREKWDCTSYLAQTAGSDSAKCAGARSLASYPETACAGSCSTSGGSATIRSATCSRRARPAEVRCFSAAVCDRIEQAVANRRPPRAPVRLVNSTVPPGGWAGSTLIPSGLCDCSCKRSSIRGTYVFGVWSGSPSGHASASSPDLSGNPTVTRVTLDFRAAGSMSESVFSEDRKRTGYNDLSR
jgi:hypothetical protein